MFYYFDFDVFEVVNNFDFDVLEVLHDFDLAAGVLEKLYDGYIFHTGKFYYEIRCKDTKNI